MYRLLTIGIGITAVALLALGCGSSSDGETTVEVLTKPQFIKQAEGACAEIAKQRGAAYAAWQKEHPGNSSQDLIDDAFREVIGPAIQEQVAALEALSPPAGDAAKIDQMVKNLAKAGQKISSEGTRGTGAQEVFEFQRQAGSYGLETCAVIY